MKKPEINNILVRFNIEDSHESLNVNFDPAHETVWLTQAQIAELFETTTENVVMHLQNIVKENENDEKATTKVFLVVRNEGQERLKGR